MALKNKYPIFIPSKGRYDKNITAKSFDQIGADYTLVVEPQEYDLYAKSVSKDKLHATPHSNKGLTVTRNYIWDLAESQGHKRFWTFDDNIYHLYRLNRNIKMRVLDTTILHIIEQFVERYENVPIAGMNYHAFCKQTDPVPPYYLNTRVYSNMLIQTDLKDADGSPMRNKLYFNDDTDLCLRVLKMGYCTLLFNAFLVDKEVTMRHKGGMTESYLEDSRKAFVDELHQAHPDVVKITQKFNRTHHHVNYKPFQKNKLIRREGLNTPNQINNYGMTIVPLKQHHANTLH